MAILANTTVMLPGYTPYPRYGRVARLLEEGKVHVTAIQCGDPRCASEHQHGDGIWDSSALEAANAYQPQAAWEHGRRSSPNAPIAE